jgi:hypothetical protein
MPTGSNRQDRAWRDFSRAFREDGLPKILSSSVCLSIVGGDGTDFDVKQAVEIGAMLLLGKPLLLVCAPGTMVPAGLRRAADEIIEDWDPTDASSQDRVTAAIQRLVEGDIAKGAGS